MRKFLTLVITAAVLLLLPISALAAPSRSAKFVIGRASYEVDGQVKQMDAVAFIQNDRAYVPVRYLALALGVPEDKIIWSSSAKTVTLIKGDVAVVMAVGGNVFYVNGQPRQMDVAPVIYGGRTYLPASWVAEALGYQVKWNPKDQTVLVYPPGQEPSEEKLQPGESTKKNGDSSSQPEQYALKKVARQAKNSVLVVQVFDSAGREIVLGSGVAVGSAEVVTNFHVVAEGYRVTITGETGFTSEVRGILAYDERADIAVLRTAADQLTPAVLGDSDKIEVGDKVVAIGSPLGLQNTVSEGIVSGLREFEGRKFIQTTAPISPGSSGGGLFDLNGRLIGITAASFVKGQNLNLAIPINTVKPLLAAAFRAQPIPFPLSVSPVPVKEVNVTNILDVLAWEAGTFQTSVGPISFEYGRSTASLDDYRFCLEAIIRPYDYMKWLLLSDWERKKILRQMAEIINRESQGATFVLTVFYQDWWTSYPSSFEPSEVQLFWDGYRWVWLVTHVIGRAWTDEANIYWSAEP